MIAILQALVQMLLQPWHIWRNDVRSFIRGISEFDPKDFAPEWMHDLL